MRALFILMAAAISLSACSSVVWTKSGETEGAGLVQLDKCRHDAETASPDASLNLSKGDIWDEAVIDRGYRIRDCMAAHDWTAMSR